VTRSGRDLDQAIDEVRRLREEFWRDVRVVGDGARLNQELERAGRVADYLELAELMCVDALDREESCGAHFRVEHATPEGEALRDDDHWCSVSAWESRPDGRPVRHDEPLSFTHVPLRTRSYR
jgi:succinate dehydrogenase / fumarate reductase flavoprotein subunit